MDSKDFQYIPTDIIDNWAKGDYYSGDIPSISYKRLGIALSLRGWYTYEGLTTKDPKFRGVAKIDLKGPSLFMGGIRLYSNPGKKDIVFWRSEFSHFLSDNEIIWFYYIFNYRDPEVTKHYFSDEWLGNMNNFFAEPQFGLSDQAWNNLLDGIRNRFDDDIAGVEARCSESQKDKVLLHYYIREQKAQYRQIFSEEALDHKSIAGSSQYIRVYKK